MGDSFSRWIPRAFEYSLIFLRELGGGDPHSDYHSFSEQKYNWKPLQAFTQMGIVFLFLLSLTPLFFSLALLFFSS